MNTLARLLMASGVALAWMPSAFGQSQRDFAEGNRRTDMMLQQGHQQMLEMTRPNYGGSPPFPLFRCDGQRPPLMGAENCPNWRALKTQERLMKKQERLIDLQIKELEAHRRRKN